MPPTYLSAAPRGLPFRCALRRPARTWPSRRRACSPLRALRRPARTWPSRRRACSPLRLAAGVCVLGAVPALQTSSSGPAPPVVGGFSWVGAGVVCRLRAVGVTCTPTGLFLSPNGRGRAGGAGCVDVKRQQSTQPAPEARHRTQGRRIAQRRDAPRRRRQVRGRHRKAQRTGAQRLPRLACSRSMASKRALKLPLPKPREPCRSIISKKTVGRSWTGLVKICSR